MEPPPTATLFYAFQKKKKEKRLGTREEEERVRGERKDVRNPFNFSGAKVLLTGVEKDKAIG